MIYLICLIFYIGVLIFLYWRNDLDVIDKFGLGFIICIITFIGAMVINVTIVSLIPPNINEIEVPVQTNPITNKYYIINSSGKIIEQDNINFVVSSEVEKIKAIETITHHDAEIWGFDVVDTNYTILAPALIPTTINT